MDLTARDRLLVVAPHPDDESLGAGGLIARAVARGAAVHVVLATDGDNAAWIQRVWERRWRIGEPDRRRFGVWRRAEAMAALAALGVAPSAVTCLAYPDQGLT